MRTRVTTHSTQTALCPFIDVLTLNLAVSFFFVHNMKDHRWGVQWPQSDKE